MRVACKRKGISRGKFTIIKVIMRLEPVLMEGYGSQEGIAT